MCGITVIHSSGRDLLKIVKRMSDSIKHRGPDARGEWLSLDKKTAFGQRRLSIIDLSKNALQPMKGLNGRTVLTYNGEVYNFKELKEKLQDKGYRFRSTSDTEVVLNSLVEHGLKAVPSFNGMWGLAYYSEDDKKIILSRDRAGIKPLYYYYDGKIFLAASEIKAILASGLVKAAVDPEGLNQYFTFQNIISDRTLFKDIKMVPQGTNLIFDTVKKTLKLEQYWDYELKEEYRSEKYYSEAILDIFKRSMDRHLIADVEIGATISGGMDSSAITAITSKYFAKLNTFTGYFDTSNIFSNDRSYSERQDAMVISKKFHTVHHERLITPKDVFKTLPGIVWHLEDPKVAMCYTYYTISELVASKLKVNLSGNGGDEVFGGYPWRYGLVEKIKNKSEFDKVFYDYWSRLVKDVQKKKFFTPKIFSKMDPKGPNKEYKKIIRAVDGLSPVNKSMYFEFKTFLHGLLLVEDKMAMAFSLESRVPFLDFEMLDLTARIPGNLKYKNGVSKYLLKKAFKPLLPECILNKRKQGFTPPDRTWYNRELKTEIRDFLLGRKAISGEYINPEFVDKTLLRHEAGSDERLLIWSLLYFEQWCRIFLANDSCEKVRGGVLK